MTKYGIVGNTHPNKELFTRCIESYLITACGKLDVNQRLKLTSINRTGIVNILLRDQSIHIWIYDNSIWHATWFFLQMRYQCLSSYSLQQLEGRATIWLYMELFAQLQGGGFDSRQIQTLGSWILISPPRNLLAQLRYQCTAHCYRENIRIIYELYFPSWNSVFQLTPYKWNNTCKVQNCSLVT